MRRAYTPTTNSFSDQLIKFLVAHPDDEFKASQLFEKTGIAVRNINHALMPAIKAGLVEIRYRGHYNTTYQAKQLPRQSPTATPLVPIFSVALISTGEIQILGASPIKDGVCLSPNQANSLRQYLLHTGSFIDHLQEQGQTP